MRTFDHVFLLSELEATSSDYGFDAYSVSDSTRLKSPTDYAKAQGVNVNSEGYSVWWLRSAGERANVAHDVLNTGSASLSHNVNITANGIVPVLVLKLS